MRTVTLLHRPSWKVLHNVDDLWTTAPERVSELLLGTAAIQRDLQVEPFKAAPGFETPLDSRPFGPYQGLRRRGEKTLKDAARAHQIEPSVLETILERLQRLFLAC